MLGAAPHDLERIDTRLWNGRVALEELGVAKDGVEWRA